MMDLGTSPPSNSYLTPEMLDAPEKWYPLRVMVCEACWLAQTVDFVDREECFSASYSYFSSCSTSWVEHARGYVDSVVKRFGIGPTSTVLEIAANDGYLLQHFVARNVPCYGIEPTESTAAAARKKGIDILSDFFGLALAGDLVQSRGRVDLVVANNVLAHVPDINDFTGGIVEILSPGGVLTAEFPHLLQLLLRKYFDTIYHEHFSYLSLHSVIAVFARAGLEVFDVEQLETHGGSLRIYAKRMDDFLHPTTDRVAAWLETEKQAGLLDPEIYLSFPRHAQEIKNNLLSFLLRVRSGGASIAAYGAAAKGNTLLNYCGVRRDFLPFVVDRSPGKIGKFLPGSRIPVHGESELQKARPDYILILPWNLREEITSQLAYCRDWGAKFVVALPELTIF